MSTSKCAKCSGMLSEEGSFVVCKGCNGRYHYECSVSSSTYNAMGHKKRVAWRCYVCRESRKNVGDEDAETSDVNAAVLENEKLKNELSEIKSILAGLQRGVADIMESQRFISNNYDEIKKSQDRIEHEFKNINNRISAMADDNKDRDKRMDDLANRMYELEQLQYGNKLEIHGVVEKDGENCAQLITKIAKKLDIGLSLNDLDFVERTKPARSTGVRPIIVHFRSLAKCTEIKARKRTTVLNNEIVDTSTGGRIFINEYLSPYYKRLFWEVRQKAKNVNWKYTWIQNGKILIRKDDSSKIYNISCPSQLDTIK